MICISCPIGCRMSVSCEADAITVDGNKCVRGEQYARAEMSDPRRVVTAVIATDDDKLKFLPVKTDKPLPRRHINSLLKAIYDRKIAFPVRVGDVIMRDFQGTGVNVVATRNGL